MDKLQTINFKDKNITSKLLMSEVFVRGIKKYEDKIYSFLNFIQKNLHEKGLMFLESKKTEKMLSNTKSTVFEFRAPIKGHRILFQYGWQYSDKNINEQDIVLCKYVSDHDKISSEANSIKTNQNINFDGWEKLSEADFEVEQSCQSENFNNKKIYYYNDNIKHLLPVLDKDQEEILKDQNQYVLVNGIAGSGKTNLCIKKLLVECGACNKVLYSTFSKALLNSTQEFIYFNYIDKLRKALNDFKAYGLTNNVILEINNLNLNSVDFYNVENNLNNILSKLQSINYKMPYEIYNEKNNSAFELVDFNIFQKLFNESDMLTYDLKNKFNSADISLEVVFKEIEGVVLGLNSKDMIISFEEYQKERGEVFDFKNLKIIYDIAKSYFEYIIKSKQYVDKNLIAYYLINNLALQNYYDIVVLDEVQDFTQKELMAFKHMAKRIFAVGDPLQMINPSYFSFNKLKQLFGDEHKEYVLDLNYRNTENLNTAINALLTINKNKLGHHSNILKDVKTAGSQDSTYLFYTDNNEILHNLNMSDFNDYTLVVASNEEKKLYNYNNQGKEVLTISEVKGLERGTIVLHNVLSRNMIEWQKLESNQINKKIADENSLLRYYFNIFYVGITRAKRHLLVVEDSNIKTFEDFFKTNFLYLDENTSINTLQLKLDLKTLTQEERIERINEAFKNGLFENAKHYIDWIIDDTEKNKQLLRFEVYSNLKKDNYQDMLDKCIQLNLQEDAIEIAKQMKDFDVATVLQQIYFSRQTELPLCYEILAKTQSDKIASIIKKALANSREELMEKNNLLQEILKEL